MNHEMFVKGRATAMFFLKLSIVHLRILSDSYNYNPGFDMMGRKRRKSENTKDKRACMTPSMFQTPISGYKEQQSPHFEEWDASEVASFLSRNGFDEHALVFQGIITPI